MVDCICCTPKFLKPELLLESARIARETNPLNHPQELTRAGGLEPAMAPTPERIAVLTSKWWKSGGKTFSVKFLDTRESALKARILSHMNAWSAHCNVAFRESADSGAHVRVARAEDGYWSYVGTDILLIPRGEPTMNLQGFTADSSEAEYRRVVRHETGHTLGCPHEHMRKQIIRKIDRAKAIEYYRQTQGWSEAQTIRQVLTPLSESSILGTPDTDRTSIMCYQIPGSITKDGVAIPGGSDIDAIDAAFMGKVYPRPGAPRPSPDPATPEPDAPPRPDPNEPRDIVRDNDAADELARLRAEVARLTGERDALEKTLRILLAKRD